MSAVEREEKESSEVGGKSTEDVKSTEDEKKAPEPHHEPTE